MNPPNNFICQQSNKNRLPPLQSAIYHKNIEAIGHLLHEGFSLTSKDEEGKLNLTDHENLPLYLIYIDAGWIKRFPQKPKKTFYAGFLMERESSIQWVVTELPELTKTKMLEPSAKVYPLDVLSIKTALESIVKCRCPQPLLVAFKQRLIEPNVIISEGIHLSQYISTHGTVEVVKQYLEQHSETLYEGVEAQKSMIESAIDNPKVLKLLLEILSQRENIIPSEASKITNCLSNSLKLSIESNDIAALGLLLNHVDMFNYTYTSNRDTLLQLTLAQGEKPEFLKLLLEKISGLTDQSLTHIKDKQDKLIPFIDWKNNESHTALHLAVLKDLKESLAIILQYSDISVSDNEGNSALHLAVKTQNLAMVRTIVSRIVEIDSELLNQTNTIGCTPLHLAVECENKEITLHLLENDVTYNLADNNGYTVLHYAVMIRNPDTRASLINCILDHENKIPTNYPLTRESDKTHSYTPLHLAVVLQYFDAVKPILLADPKCLKNKDKNGQTVLHIAVTPKLNNLEYSLSLEQANQAIFNQILDTVKEQEKIISDSGETEERLSSYKDSEGKTVIHLCLKFENIHALSELLDTNPCLNITDNIGNAPIHEAVLIQSTTGKKCLDLLLKAIKRFRPKEEHNEYLYALNGNSVTPLHSAIQENNKFTVECLQEHEIQLAFENYNSSITLLDDGQAFSLSFLKSNDGEFYVGYTITYLRIDYWVVSQIPTLETTHIFEKSHPDIIHLNDFVEIAILAIIKCRSSEPLQAAFRKDLIDPEGRINKKHMSQLVSENATKEVMSFYLVEHHWALYHFPEDTSMIECAVSNIDHRTLELLLQKLPDIDRQELLTFTEDNPNPTEQQLVSLCLYKSLRKSIFNISTEALSLLLEYKARINYTYDPVSDTLLHLIVKNRNQASFAELILERLKVTPEVYLTHFDNIPFIDAKNDEGKTVLHLSVESLEYNTFKTLLEYLPNLLIQDKNGDTALHLAVKMKRKSFVEDIIRVALGNSAVLEAKNNHGYSPLHCSIDVAQCAIAEFLLTNGSNFYSIDHNQQTLLHHAVMLSNIHFRKAMVAFISQYETLNLQKCEIAQMQDNRKYCPLHLAVSLQHSDIIESILLIDSGVLTLRDLEQRSVLHLSILARENSEDHIVQERIFDKILNEILSKEMAPDDGQCPIPRIINYQDSFGKTALHYCLQLNDTNALAKLLDTSPDFGLKDQDENTPLHQAVFNYSYADCLHSLLDAMRAEQRAYFYSLNNSHLPPLQLAILSNNYPAIKILLSRLNQFQLAFPHPKSKEITLCDGIEGFSLKFFSEISTCSYYTVYTISFKGTEYCIVSRLPELDTTCIVEKSEGLEELATSVQPALFSIMKCRSQEPLRAAFRNQLLSPNQHLEDMFVSQFAGRHATKEVMEYYLQVHKVTLFYFGEKLSMIESAILNPDLETLHLLLKALKQVDTTQEDVKAHIATCLHKSLELSLENESSDALSLLLQYDSRPNDLYSSQDNTLLHQIILKNKNPEFLACLLDKITSLENDNPGSTKINNENFIDVKNCDTKTAMHLSIELQQNFNLERLLEYQPGLDVQDSNKNTALHLAVSIQILEFVQKIVNEITKTDYKVLMDAKNNQGCTPLHLAVYFGNIEITDYLLQNGCDFQVVDKFEQNLLHYAVSIPECEINLRTDANNFQKDNQYSSLEYPHIVNFILEKYPSLLTATDKRKRTPLHLAVIQHHYNSFFCLLKAIDEGGKQSPDHNCFISCQDYQGKTALHHSIQYRNYYALNSLLAMNPCLHLEDENENSALHYATIRPIDGYSIQQVLVSIKTRFEDQFEDYIYHTNILKLTPLQYAIKYAHIMAIETMVNNFGVSIVHIHQNIIKLNFNIDLPLRFYNSKSEPRQFYIGYSFDITEGIANGVEKFVVCKIPLCFDNLSKTEILQNDEIEEILNLNEDLLIQILLSQTSEPLEAYLKIISLEISLSKGSTLMHFAAQYGTQQVVRFLISEFDELQHEYEKQDEDRNSILHLAIHNEDFQSVVLLLSEVKDYEVSPPRNRIIDFKNKDDLSALDVALKNDRIKVFLEYIKFENNATLNYYDPSQNTLLHHIVVSHRDRTEGYLTALFENINKREYQKKLSTLIEGTPFIDCYSQNKYTALHLSILHGNIVALNILTGNNSQLSLSTLDDGNSIVHLAVLCPEDENYLRIILDAILASNKPDYYELLNMKNKGGYCPLHLAIADAKYDYVKCLLQPTDNPSVKTEKYTEVSNEQLFVRDPEGYTPLHYATLLDTKEAINIIDFLFSSEEERRIMDRTILNQRCYHGKTPLHLAISKGNYFSIQDYNEALVVEILNLIFDLAKIIAPEFDHLLCIDHDLCSILHHAVVANNIEILKCVMSRLTTEPIEKYCLNRFGKPLLNLQDKYGRTALIIAIEKENIIIFRELLKYFPSLHCRDDVNQWTVLHHAIEIHSKNTKFFDRITKHLENKELELQSLINIMDKNDHTALHLAIKRENEQLVDLLVKGGANIAVEKEFGSDIYTVGAYGDKALEVEFGWKEEKETNLHVYVLVYLIMYRVSSKYLISTLPKFATELMDEKTFDRDVQLHSSSAGDLETLVKKVVSTKCPELIEKMLLEKMITIENAPEINLMYLAAQNGTKAVMKYLCEEKLPKFDYESQDTYGNTLIHFGVKNNEDNIKTLKYILKMTENFEKKKVEKLPRKIINYSNNRKLTALQLSINQKKCKFFIALINRGAIFTQQNHDGNSIIHLLTLEDPKSIMNIKLVVDSILKNELLKSKLTNFLSIKNHDGLTALQIAIMGCHNEIVKFLLKNKASTKDINPINRNTIVHMTTLNGWDESDMESISIVLNAVRQQDKDKIILRVRNIDLETPLHISVRDKDKFFMTKSLLDVGVPLEICNRDRNTALHIAALNEDNDTLEILMQHLIKKAKEHQLADRRLEYMRELVRENKNKLMPISIPKKKKNLKTMLRAWNQYHEVNMGDGRRGLLIHLAVYNQKSELVDGILESIKEIEERHEIDYQNLLSSRDTDDMTPLHVAAEVGDEQIADLLIRYGADIQLNSARGTPVEIAMQKDHIYLALRLVKRGAKINKYLDLLTYDKISDRDIQEIFDKKKINVERRISSADCTVIHYAAKQSSVSRIALLLRNDIALTTSDRDGKRVLHYAVQYRDNYEVLNFFLDEAYKRDEVVQRKLERKSEEEQLEYEELYLSYMEALFYHDLDGITPVMLAANLDKIQLFRLLTTPKYEYILDTFDTCDPNENNVMHYLAKYKSIKVARYIVPRLYKYDVHLFTSIMNDRNTRGDSPIDLARKRGLQEMVDLFIDHCDCEYFEACPDVVHRMVKGKDFHNFEKVLEKTVNQDTQNVQIATKLMDSNEEGAYPNFAYFNFHLDPLWHKMYKSNETKYKYHPIVKFLIDEKLTVYKWWFLKLFLLYLFLFYIPFATALSLASSRCDYELFLYNTHEDRLRFLLEMYILLFTWVYMMNEVFEIFGKYRYLETLDETTNDLRYQRRHHVQYYGDEESDKFTRWIQNKVKRIFFEIPTILKERLYRLERSDHFRFFPRFMFRAIYRHFRDTYNIIDFAGVLLLLSLFFFRTLLYFSKSDGVIGIHWAIQALTFSVFTLKFFKYTKMIPSLGIYIETLSNVLSRDVPRFTLVILIVLIGYTGSIQQVARTNKLSQCDKGSCSFSDWFNDDSIPFSPITTPLISGILFILDGGPSNYEGSLRNVSFLFSVVYLIFAFSIIVILLNVFIAQLSQTYSDINSKKDLLDFKADLALEYETQSNILFAFRSPITRALKRIMIQSIIIPVDVWKEYLDSYLKRVSASPGSSDGENGQVGIEHDGSEIEKQQSIQNIQNTIDRIEDRILKKLPLIPVSIETTDPGNEKKKQGQEEDLKDIKNKMERMEEKLTDLCDFVRQNKPSTKFDNPQGVKI